MSLIDTLKSMIHGAKDLHELQAGKKQEAFGKCMDACMASRTLFVAYQSQFATTGMVNRDLVREAEIAHKWAGVSAAFLYIDKFFSQQCLEVANYWSDPRADPIRDAANLFRLFGTLKSSCHPDVDAKPGATQDRVLICATDVFSGTAQLHYSTQHVARA